MTTLCNIELMMHPIYAYAVHQTYAYDMPHTHKTLFKELQLPRRTRTAEGEVTAI